MIAFDLASPTFGTSLLQRLQQFAAEVSQWVTKCCLLLSKRLERTVCEPPTRRCDEAALIEIVERAMHPSASEWLFLRELRVGTGRQNGGAQRLDAFALNTLPHTAMKRASAMK